MASPRPLGLCAAPLQAGVSPQPRARINSQAGGGGGGPAQPHASAHSTGPGARPVCLARGTWWAGQPDLDRVRREAAHPSLPLHTHIRVGPCTLTSESALALSHPSRPLHSHIRVGPCILTSESAFTFSHPSRPKHSRLLAWFSARGGGEGGRGKGATRVPLLRRLTAGSRRRGQPHLTYLTQKTPPLPHTRAAPSTLSPFLA